MCVYVNECCVCVYRGRPEVGVGSPGADVVGNGPPRLGARNCSQIFCDRNCSWLQSPCSSPLENSATTLRSVVLGWTRWMLSSFYVSMPASLSPSLPAFALSEPFVWLETQASPSCFLWAVCSSWELGGRCLPSWVWWGAARFPAFGSRGRRIFVGSKPAWST